ncbi:MAG: hypothetical protein CMN30_26265 [Sandaracinus sp.]|nr:hypothetical protein [Sandaracinus sp.]
MIVPASTVLALLLTSGCYVRTYHRPPTARVRVSGSAQASAPPPPSSQVTVTAQSPTVATGVTVVEATCTQGAAEECNGLDDNCNGQIDEGCGFSSGNIQVTLAWPTQADLDLYVTDPNGEQVYYQHTQAASGGRLDQDARGGCNNAQADNNLENVYWDQANPPSGAYQVAVHYWDGARCSTNAGATTFTLSIAVGGQIAGAYNYTIAPGQRVDVASFQL